MNIAQLFAHASGPIVLTPLGDRSIDALYDILRTHGKALFDEHGCLLLRGFAVDSAANFDSVAQAMGACPFTYVGGNSPRTRLSERIYTSTEYPASEVISLHNEMSYLRQWPSRLFFFSEVPAGSGGQTSLADGSQILEALPPAIVECFRTKKLAYIRNFPVNSKVGKSWQSTYETKDREQLEEILQRQNSNCEWSADGALKVITKCDATTIQSGSGTETWFNQAEQWHPSALPPAIRTVFERSGLLAHDCRHGDGSPLDESMLLIIRETVNRHKLLFDWQRGDVLVIDNVRFMHGRESFKGTRRTLTYLSVN